jgi:RNA 2',3'-cyclic 3'-phosphodiesterase
MAGEPIQLQFNKVEYWRKPGIVALVADRTPPTAPVIGDTVARKCRFVGIPDGRSTISPHVTLARFAPPISGQRLPAVFYWNAENFALVESTRDTNGETLYRPLHQWSLKAESKSGR